MNSVKSISPRRLAANLIQIFKASILARLANFCKKRVIEVGLTSAALAGEYHIGSNNIEARKNIGRLKVLIYKYLIKRIPYLALSQTDFLQIINRQSIQVVYESPQITSDFSYVNWLLVCNKKIMSNYDVYGGNGIYKSIAAREHPKNLWASRYVRYLNYLCRKHGIPIFAHVLADLKFDTQIASETSKLGTIDRAKVVIPFSMVMTIQFEFVHWYSTDETLHAQVRSGEVNNDAFYADSAKWSYRGVVGRESNYGPESPSNVFCIEKLFLHLDKVLVSLSTLTRKAYYETSAYSFRIASND